MAKDILTEDDLKTLLFLVRNRLHYESRRPPRLDKDGHDMQTEKVWRLSDLVATLERMQEASEPTKQANRRRPPRTIPKDRNS